LTLPCFVTPACTHVQGDRAPQLMRPETRAEQVICSAADASTWLHLHQSVAKHIETDRCWASETGTSVLVRAGQLLYGVWPIAMRGIAEGGAAMRLHVVISALLLVLFLTGCTAGTSGDYNTIALRPEIVVTSEGTGHATVSARIMRGIQTVRLDSGDDLSASACGETHRLSLGIGANAVYEAVFTPDCIGEYVVAFTRANDASSPNSTVSLPEGFEMTSPQAGTRVSPGDSLHVVWDAAGVWIDVGVSGSCQEQGNETRHIDHTMTVNTGSADIAVSDLIGSAPLGANETCAVTVSLERVSVGDVDPAFGGGSIVAKQVRSVEVEISP